MRVLDVDARRGILRLEAVDELSHVAQTNGIDRRHLDGRTTLGVVAADGRFQFVILFEDRLAAIEIKLAERRQLQAADWNGR